MKMAGMAPATWTKECVEWRIETAIATARGNYMETPGKQNPAEAEAHIASAQQILKALQEKIGEHPEIGEAITKLEMALNVLAIKTGGLL